MRIIIQAVIVIVIVLAVFMVLGRRGTHSGKAWKKIGLVFLSIGAVLAALFPESTNYIADMVGVGRGADLLLYGTVVAFVVYVLNNYLYQQDQRDSLYRLARKVAIVEAKERQKERMK